jgi:hypothetical protein
MTLHTYSVLSSSKVMLLLQRCERLNGTTGEMNFAISFPAKSFLTYKFLNACSHPFLYQGNVHRPCFIHHNYVSILSLLLGFVLWPAWGTSNISEFTPLQFDIRGMLLPYWYASRQFSCLTYVLFPCFIWVNHICQVSTGYFIADLAMIFFVLSFPWWNGVCK